MKEKKSTSPAHPSLKKNIKKSSKKAVHQGIKQAREVPLEEETMSTANSFKTTLSKLPSKRAAKEKAQIASLEKNIKMKKTKNQKHLAHHNTTPGEIEGKPAAPKHIHIEGKRWGKTLQKQTKAKNKILTKKGLKKHR